LSFFLTIPGLIGSAFVVGLLFSLVFSRWWAAIGCALPFVAGALIAIRISALAVHHSTEGLEIPFGAFWTLCGSLPGAALGSLLRSFWNRKKRQEGQA